MAFLTKLASSQVDAAQSPPRTNWVLYVSGQELQELTASVDVGFVVAVPKDAPLLDTVATIVLKRMPAELADRHTIAREFEGDPAAIAQKVLDASKARLEELIGIVGGEAADAVLADHKARGGGKGSTGG